MARAAGQGSARAAGHRPDAEYAVKGPPRGQWAAGTHKDLTPFSTVFNDASSATRPGAHCKDAPARPATASTSATTVSPVSSRLNGRNCMVTERPTVSSEQPFGSSAGRAYTIQRRMARFRHSDDAFALVDIGAIAAGAIEPVIMGSPLVVVRGRESGDRQAISRACGCLGLEPPASPPI